MSNKRMLVVEDEADLGKIVADYFSEIGFSVDLATDLEAAQGLLNQDNYSILLSDMRIGKHTVDEALELLRHTHNASPTTSIIALSGALDDELIGRIKDVGVRAVFKKPKSLGEIGQTVLALSEEHPAIRIEELRHEPTGPEIGRLLASGQTLIEIARFYGRPESIVRSTLQIWTQSMSPKERMFMASRLTHESQVH